MHTDTSGRPGRIKHPRIPGNIWLSCVVWARICGWLLQFFNYLLYILRIFTGKFLSHSTIQFWGWDNDLIRYCWVSFTFCIATERMSWMSYNWFVFFVDQTTCPFLTLKTCSFQPHWHSKQKIKISLGIPNSLKQSTKQNLGNIDILNF